MNAQHFQTQMTRLIEVFGKNVYPRERAQLIWREVQGYEDAWFSRIVDDFIGNSRQAPLLPEFREAISIERERLWRIQKAQEKKDAKEFMSVLTGDDINTICGAIIKRVQGKMSDGDFASLNKMLDGLDPHKRPIHCPRCQDTKVYWDGAGFTYCEHKF